MGDYLWSAHRERKVNDQKSTAAEPHSREGGYGEKYQKINHILPRYHHNTRHDDEQGKGNFEQAEFELCK